MSATLTRTLAAGALGALLATAGSALAATLPSIDDLGPVLNTELAQRQNQTATATATKPADKTDASVQMVSLEDAAAGKRPAWRCKTVTGIRGWRAARRSLLRRGFRRLHVLRFTPRKVTPIARLKGYARCAGGWYVLTATRGAVRYRLAVDGRSLRVAAITRIGVDRRRDRQARRVHRGYRGYRGYRARTMTPTRRRLGRY